MWRVLIVDDEKMARDRLVELLQREPDFQLVGEAEDGSNAIDAIQRLSPDLVLLDVHMPELDGFDVIDGVGADRMPFVIFVTAYNDHAVAAFDANAVDYVLKPYDDARFSKALDRTRERLLQREAPAAIPIAPWAPYRSRLTVRNGGGYEVIGVDAVVRLEALDNYVRVHTASTSYLIRTTLASVFETLDPQRFLRIHRSTIVNVSQVKRITTFNKTEFMVTLLDGTRLPSSRKYRREIAAFIHGSSHGIVVNRKGRS